MNYNHCTPRSYPAGPCGGSFLDSCAVFDSKQGSSTKPPYVTETAYDRRVGHSERGSVLYLPTGTLSPFTSCYGDIGTSFPPDPNVSLRLIGNLASEVRGHDFSPGVSLGEANESLGMLGSAAKRLANVASALPKLVPASLWLEAVYGWMPLWNDLHSGAQFFASALSRPRRRTYRATAFEKGSIRSASAINWTAYGTANRLHYAVVHVEENESNLAFTGVIDPLSVAWELTPYSFVADWFIPIGNWLEARSFLASLKASGCTGVVERVYGSVGRFHPQSRDWRMVSPASYKRVHHTRTPGLPSLPPPRFTPLKRLLSNWRHFADGFALASQAFSGKRVKR